LEKGTYSVYSDVYSFSIVLWEIASQAEERNVIRFFLFNFICYSFLLTIAFAGQNLIQVSGSILKGNYFSLMLFSLTKKN
jgi:hypothetical protein